jgi:hypothetical protein
MISFKFTFITNKHNLTCLMLDITYACFKTCDYKLFLYEDETSCYEILNSFFHHLYNIVDIEVPQELIKLSSNYNRSYFKQVRVEKLSIPNSGFGSTFLIHFYNSIFFPKQETSPYNNNLHIM